MNNLWAFVVDVSTWRRANDAFTVARAGRSTVTSGAFINNGHSVDAFTMQLRSLFEFCFRAAIGYITRMEARRL